MKILCLSVGNNGLGWETNFSVLGLEFYVYRSSRRVWSVGVAFGDKAWEKIFK